MSSPTPYDELPYRSVPIEWTAPERMALVSLLHGGPRPRLDGYRVLELGCGDGANLIPMAYFRRHATFVGVDGAHTRVAIAEQRRTSLGLANVSFVAADFTSAADRVAGPFDFIVAHGVFSWVDDDARDALLRLCADRLRAGGLCCLSYNTTPGWSVRGLVRDFLLLHTAAGKGLQARVDRAREVAAAMARELAGADHPYSQLLANEFRFVCENHPSHTAHEYLAPHNVAYSRQAFLDLVARHGLVHVGDADYNRPSGRLPEALPSVLARLPIDASLHGRAADLLCYRQMHSPLLSRGFVPRAPDPAELAALTVASPLVCRDTSPGGARFDHPDGHEVEVRGAALTAVLRALESRWPRGTTVGEAFPDVAGVIDDLRLLQRNGMIELHAIDPEACGEDPEPLNRLERSWGGYETTAAHAVRLTGG